MPVDVVILPHFRQPFDSFETHSILRESRDLGMNRSWLRGIPYTSGNAEQLLRWIPVVYFMQPIYESAGAGVKSLETAFGRTNEL